MFLTFLCLKRGVFLAKQIIKNKLLKPISFIVFIFHLRKTRFSCIYRYSYQETSEESAFAWLESGEVAERVGACDEAGCEARLRLVLHLLRLLVELHVLVQLLRELRALAHECGSHVVEERRIREHQTRHPTRARVSAHVQQCLEKRLDAREQARAAVERVVQDVARERRESRALKQLARLQQIRLGRRLVCLTKQL